MKINIRTKILLIFSLVIAVCVGAIVFNFYLLNYLVQQTSHIFNVVDPTVEAVYDLRQSFNIDIREIEEYGNGYVTDAAEVEKVIEPAEAKIDEDIKIIEASKLVPQERTLSLLATLKRDEEADEKIFDLRKNSKEDTKQHVISPEIYQALRTFDTISNKVNQEIKEIVDIIEKHKKDNIKIFIGETEKNRLYILAAFSAAIVLSVIIIYIAAFLLSGSIKKVRDTALKMSQGDLSQRASITSKDEIGDLAITFNQMAESVEESQGKLQKTDQELQQINTTLKEKLAELQKFKELTVDRELKMVELKEEIAKCRNEAIKNDRY